jgi:DNA polymerase-3 subunit delta
MRGVKFEPRAASMLADYVGGDTWRLANEIEKLAAYANGATVTAIDVQSLVTPTREEMFWILPDPVADGKAGQALKALQTLRAQNEADQAMIGSIRARFVRIAIARSMLEEGARDEEIGRRLGASGFALTRLVEQARGWPMSSLRAAFAALVQAELDVKTGLMDQDVAMDLAVVGVADLRK